MPVAPSPDNVPITWEQAVNGVRPRLTTEERPEDVTLTGSSTGPDPQSLARWEVPLANPLMSRYCDFSTPGYYRVHWRFRTYLSSEIILYRSPAGATVEDRVSDDGLVEDPEEGG